MRSRGPWSAIARRLAQAGLLLIFWRVPAFSQQIFLNSVWVAAPLLNGGANCVFIGQSNFQGQFWCPGPPTAVGPGQANISNDPRIEFDQLAGQTACLGAGHPPNSSLPFGDSLSNVCNQTLFLCTNVGFNNLQSSTTIALDQIMFEVFKFINATSNPLDPNSTPPLRTFFVDNPGTLPAASSGTLPAGSDCMNLLVGGSRVNLGAGCGTCVPWDGSYGIGGFIGKTNGIYGFRATVETNQQNPTVGNIQISMTRAYPSGATQDCQPTGSCAGASNFVLQQPITVDVSNIHVVQTSSTLVGSITAIPSEPYNLTYRLSKDALMSINILATNPTVQYPGASSQNPQQVRQLVGSLSRVGEGIPTGTLQNGDAWNGREDNGDFAPPGVYLESLAAVVNNQFGQDLSAPTTATISLDPLQITDILTVPLTSQSTALATITYTLTEPATVYVNIYPPGTHFCSGLTNVNTAISDQPSSPLQPKDFEPGLAGCTGIAGFPGSNAVGGAIQPIRAFTEQKDFRKPVLTFWDGRDSNGNEVPDGNYVFVIYAALASKNGTQFGSLSYPAGPASCGAFTDCRIWTSKALSGFLPISRGMVTISQISPATTVLGSSPAVAGLNPFVFSYSLSRDSIINVGIYDQSGSKLIRTLVKNEVRPGNFLNREIWSDGTDDNGLMVASGTYLAQLTAADPIFPIKVTTTTAIFPINLVRITDVLTTPLLAGSTDVTTIGYQLSQSMNVSWNIYPAGTVIHNAAVAWPPCGVLTPGACPASPRQSYTTFGANGSPVAPIITISGMRPGRLFVTEFWDGRDTNGLYVPDGSYVFTLTAQSTMTPQYFATDRIFGTLTVARGSTLFKSFSVVPSIPALFASSAPITLPPFAVQYSLVRQSSVTINILNTLNPPTVVRHLLSGEVDDSGILLQQFWDGTDDSRNFVRPGFYIVQGIAQDIGTEVSSLTSGTTVQATISVDPLQIFDVARAPFQSNAAPAEIDYQVSEPMKTSLKIYKPGTSFDSNGNPVPPESQSLVRVIVSVEPPTPTQIRQSWDGLDQRLAIVPDGNYVFKLIASTDATAIDSITGNVRPGASLADTLIVDNISVLRGHSLDAEGDFQNNTFIFPNPVSGSQANVSVFVPFQSNVDVKIFNLAGQLVFERSFPNQAPTINNPSGPVSFSWTRVNNAGRQVAPGVYFVLVREQDTLGGGNVLQTVKKILLQ